MKKLFLLLLIVPMISFGQNNNVSVKTENSSIFNELSKQKESDGVHYLGRGVYESIRVKGSFTNTKKLLKEAKQTAIEYAKSQKNGIISIIGEKKIKYSPGVFPKGIVTFKIINANGELVLSRKDAKNELMELKEFLDLGIITKEEFDKKAASLKKTLLGN